MMDEVLSTKETREGVLGARRATMSGEFTLPDPSRDVSESLLASVELGINSVCWAMVKNELSADGEYKDLADWISGGPPEVLPDCTGESGISCGLSTWFPCWTNGRLCPSS